MAHMCHLPAHDDVMRLSCKHPFCWCCPLEVQQKARMHSDQCLEDPGWQAERPDEAAAVHRHFLCMPMHGHGSTGMTAGSHVQPLHVTYDLIDVLLVL